MTKTMRGITLMMVMVVTILRVDCHCDKGDDENDDNKEEKERE